MKHLLLVVCCLSLSLPTAAQNLPGVPANATAEPSPNPVTQQRAPLGPQARIERWQLTAELKDREGRPWRLQWTLYRRVPGALPAAAGTPAGSMALAHAALTTPDGDYREQHFAHGKISRAGDGIVVAPAGSVAGMNEWEWVSQGAATLPARLGFSIAGRDLNLLLESTAAPATDDGGAPGHRRIRVRGFVDRGASKTYLRGRGRLDREAAKLALAGNRPAGD